MQKDYKIALFVAFVSLAVFANSLQNKFVYDDMEFVAENGAIRSLKNIPMFFTSLKAFTTKGDFYIYRPLSTLSYAVDYFTAKLNPFMFHLTSVLWHALVSVVLYLLLSLLLENRTQSLLATLLFSVHPVQVESVAWVSQRSNLISLFFFLLAFYFWARGKNFYIASVACYFMALLGKEMAITLPLVLMLHDVCFPPNRDPDRVGAGTKWKRYLPFFIVAIFYIALRTAVLGRVSGQDAYVGGSMYTAMLTLAKSVVFYIRILLLPVRLCVDYRLIPAVSLVEEGVILSIISVLLFLCAGLLFLARKKKEGFFMLFFLITLLPVSNLIPLQEVIVAERFMYFPSIGFCALMTLLAFRAGETKKIVTVLVSLLIVFHSLLTINRNRTWKDGLTLWNATLKEKSHTYRTYGNLGIAYIDRGRYGDAVESFKKVILSNPNDVLAYYNMGIACIALKDYNQAIASFKQAIKLKPDYIEAYTNMGVACAELKRYDEAIAAFKEVLRINPSDAKSYYNLALSYGKQGRHDEEIESFKQALRINPGYDKAHYNMGLFYMESDRLNEAVEPLKQAIRANPNHTESYFNLGVVYGKLARYNEALDSLRQAIRINPDYSEAYYTLGLIYINMDRPEQAIEPLKQAIRINPDYSDSHCNLGMVYGKLGRYNDAIESLEMAIRMRKDDELAHYNLGMVYDKLGRYSDAIQSYKEAVAVKSDYAAAYYALGVDYTELGRYNDAVSSFKEAVRINPACAEAQYGLGVACLKTGERKSAMEQCAILKKANPELADKLLNMLRIAGYTGD